jgi:hypothetical protein
MPTFGAMLRLRSQALFFEVTTEKTHKSQAVGGRRIPPFKERRVGHPASFPQSSHNSRVARPIAKRRAGPLGWFAPPDGGINSLRFASGCGPVRFDLDHFLFSGQIVMEAAP